MTSTRCLTLVLGAMLIFWPFAQGKASINEGGEQQEVQRRCIGLLWCAERSADSMSIDGLLWLYSSGGENSSRNRFLFVPFLQSVLAYNAGQYTHSLDV